MTLPTGDRLNLVADIGGTNTRVALAEGTRLRLDSVRKYANREFAGPEALFADYVAAEAVRCDGAAVAVAGPVRDGHGRLTNLDWEVGREGIARATGAARVAVLNDLQAQAYGLGHIAPDKLRKVVDGPAPRAGATQLVIGVGTGFNAAVALQTVAGRLVPPSESGHVDMPVQSAEAGRLAAFVARAHGFASVEDVLSGRGLENLYAWRRAEAGAETRLDAAAIMAAMAARSDPAAVEAVAWLVRLLGAVAGNLALVHLPFGGIYLIGGVSRAATPHFDEFGFAAAFRAKGRFAEFMRAFRVSVIEDDFAALAGLAAHLDGLA